MRNHHHHQQTATERAIDTAGNRCQSLCGTHPASATTSVSSSAPGATLTSMSTATAGGTVKSPIMLDDDLSSLQASHAKLPQKQQQKHQHPNKLAAMSSATNNNNNNNHSEKVKITSNSITKYTTVTLPSLLANNHRENSAATMLHVNRKQFTPTSDGSNASFSSASVAGSIQDDMSDQCSLTQAGLEEYNIRASSYYDQPVLFHHQKQSSYAQSEGYHSYVSSSDSSSATPFLDRLRQESDLLSRQSSHNWSQNDLSSLSCASIAPSPLPMTTLMQDSGVAVTGVVGDVVNNNNNINNNNSSNNNNNSIKLNDSCSNGSKSNGATTINIVTVNNNISGSCSTNNNANNGSSSTNSTNSNHHHNHNSSESTSSTETLKWLGSTSDISEASHATGYSAISESVSSSQLIVHSSRVLTPKRHHSESVLYLNDDRPCSPPLNGNVVVVGGVHHATTPQEAPPSGPSARGVPNHRYSPSYPPVHTIPNHNMHQSYHQHQTTFGGSMKTDTGGSLTTLKHVPMELGSPLNGSDEEACPATQANHKSSISVTLQPGGGILPGACQAVDEDMASEDSVASTEGANKPLTVNTAGSTAADLESPASSCNTSPSGGAKNVAATSYRSNHRLFPVSTYTEPVHSNTSHYVHHPKPQYSTGLQKPAAASVQHATASSPATTSPPQTVKPQVPQAPQASWQSVAALINDFERTTDAQPQPQQQQPMPPMQQQQQPQQQQPQQKYAYIEPTKTHRVSNPALKAIQKNAVQSYFERQQAQQQQHQQHSKDSNQLQQQQQAKLYHPQPTSLPHANAQLIRPHSYQPMASARDVATQQVLCNSLPSPPAKASPLPPQKPDKPLTPLDVYVMGGGTPKPPSPGPPPPPPRSRSLLPTVSLLRRSSSASDYGEFRDQYMRATQEKLQAQSVKNISSAEKMSFNDCGMPPPPPPPRGRPSLTTRRTSSASEYAAMRDKALLQQAAALAHQQHHPQQHNGAMRQQPPSPQQQQQQQHYYYAPPAPAMMPHEGWVPERPPKNPNMRIPSPEPPPPPPAECDASLSDEPLPPPPPEILNRPHVAPAGYNESGLPSPSSVGASDLVANRRNSFAGSSTRKALFMRATSTGNEGMVPTVMKPPPPAVPKKPNNSELLQLARPSSSLAQQQSNKAHKVVLNGGAASGANSSGGLNRKRPHANPALMSMPPPILEHHTASTTTLAACKQSPPLPPPSSSSSSATAPPPLMPRMTSITQLQGPPPPTLSHHASKQRCNSKASYLPRQSLEKLNSDPDHGSYKLTLTSNEDYVSSAVSAPPSKSSSFDSTTTTTTTILTSGGNKLPHNLPDVLPLGAKLQTQPSSPTAGPPNGGPSPGALRYGSNNNLSTGGNSPTQQHSFPMYPPPTAHRYSTPAMSAYHNIGNSSSGSVTSLASSNSNGSGSGQYPTPPLHYSRSQSYDVNRNPATVSPNGGGGGVPQSGGMHSPSKLMSQSTMDLKRVHSQLEPTLEEGHTAPGDPNSPKVLAPAQSESNLAPKLYPSEDRISEKTTKEGRIFRAECVNTTLVSAVQKAVTRKESLRENIEKITQLQSKLMSAHVGSESGLLMGGNFAATKASPANTRPLSSSELEKMPHVLEVTESAAVVEEPFQDDDVPDTPPPPPPPLTPPPSLDEDPEESLPATTATAAEEAPELPQQISQMDSATDGLKLMQRSEIVLRLNPSTSEVSCQTDDLADCDYNGMAMPQTHKDEAQTRTTLQPRRPHPIELDCDNMSRDLVALLASNDKLIAVLTPQTVKSPTDYVSNLYNPNVPLRPGKRDVGTSTLMRMKSRAGDSKADSGAAVYQFADIEVTLSNGNDEDGDESDGLKKKVDELIRHINRKIRILNNEQTSIGEESALNDELGSNLVSKLADKVRPIEASKCRTFIDDVGYITSLLLSLSERLARTENSLSGLSNGNSEKKILESKRDRLLEQLEEAKHLKEDIDRRGSVVTAVLEKHLTDEDFADFDYFINMKAKLIADSRDIADKIKCGEEQLNALSEALIQSDC